MYKNNQYLKKTLRNNLSNADKTIGRLNAFYWNTANSAAKAISRIADTIWPAPL